MRYAVQSTLVASVFLFFSTVEWAKGIPVPDDDPPADQPFPFQDFQNESSNYLVVDDMIINRDGSRAGLVDGTWPGGVVPYTFQYTIVYNQKNDILQAMKEISAATNNCIRFRPASKEDTYNIEYRNDPRSQGCSSFVGWQNRKNQPVQLSTICSKGNAIHEIYHALGFFHEQTRNDRDDYVTINFQNIQPGMEGNFKKDGELYPNAETDYFGVPYNYDSIMHYGKTYFSKNQQNTIDVKENPNGEQPPIGNPANLGQREFISEGDIMMLKTKYNCEGAGAGTGEPVVTEPSSPSSSSGPDGENNNEETVTSDPPSPNKPTTKNPYCQYNPSLPMCKQ